MLTTSLAPTKSWQQSTKSPLARQVDVSVSAARLGIYLWLDSAGFQRSTADREKRAQWLLDTLVKLGPTFIKIGQALSTRADLLPLEYVRALVKLQDQVPQFPSAQAIAIVEKELGGPISEFYKDFDPEPLAAASLGQVHRATLFSGEEVVVKVQRPGLQQLFDIDFQVLDKLVKFAKQRLRGLKNFDLEAIYQEFATILYREIDYVQEGMNADRFRQNFADHEYILVPKIYPDLTTKRVLTMEYMPGIKVNDRRSLEAIGINPKDVNHIGICAYMKQLLQDGYFQADPHPGNMAVRSDGKLIFYDFGMMAEVQAINKNQMVQTFFAVLRKDTDQVVQTMVEMGLVEPMSDMTPVRRIVKLLLEKFTDKPVEMQAFRSVRNELYAVFEEQPFRLPARLTFIIKALTTLDGVARDLDPQYNLLVAAKPFVKSLATTGIQNRGSGLGELARQAKSYVSYQIQKPNPAEAAINRLEQRLEDGELEIRVQALDTERSIRTLHLLVRSLMYACLTGFGALCGSILLVGHMTGGAVFAFVFAGVMGVCLLKAMVKLKLREQIDRIATGSF
ncbi:MAG: AarF/ABC1/UbiB kinase family protein [Alkalinema sp. RU_4_3]|nr:AarF/ABC1/UbiB kinase family protein [Alkalinema sp. RU_4_3]